MIGIKLKESLAFINVVMNCMEDLFVFDNGEFIVSKKHCINIKSRFCANMLSECYSNVTINSAFKEVVCIRFNFPATKEEKPQYFSRRDVVLDRYNYF